MPSVTEITVAQFSRLIGLPQTPAIVDVRIDDDYRSDPRMLPGSVRRDYRAIEQWAPKYEGKSVVVVCHKGQKLSEGTVAWLRHNGIEAQTLEGGFEAWKKAGELLVRTDKLPEPDAQGRTVWVTRTRPKVDRIACPWLIRRFVDPNARVPVRGAFRGARPWRTGSRRRPSTSKACSGAIVVIPAPSTP